MGAIAPEGAAEEGGEVVDEVPWGAEVDETAGAEGEDVVAGVAVVVELAEGACEACAGA